MTEIAGSDQAQSTNTAPPVEVSSSAGSESNSAPATSEKLLTQQEVNELVGRVRRETAEREARKYANQNQQSQTQQPSTDEFRRIAAEESQRLMDKSREDAYRTAQEESAQRIASEFFGKLATGKEKYQDFEKVVGEVELRAIPHVVQLANQVENTADVMYELAKNPTKIAAIQQLIGISPKLAMAEMQRLAQSIKDNESAAKEKLPNSPLSQIRPSNTGTDNGVLSVKDLRSKYRG